MPVSCKQTLSRRGCRKDELVHWEKSSAETMAANGSALSTTPLMLSSTL